MNAKLILSLITASLTLSACSTDDAPVADAGAATLRSLEAVRRAGILPGISEVRANSDGSVTMVDARHEGRGYGLMMFQDGKKVDQVRLKPGESCFLTDGHHGSHTFTFLRSENGKLHIKIVEEFNATSFGGTTTSSEGVVEISEYKNRDEAP